MNYQIKVIECKAAGLESALNQPAAEGWQLISCWPDGSNVRAVFQREARTATAFPATRPVAPAVAPTPPQPRPAAAPAIPADDKFLDAVIAAWESSKTKDGKPLPPSIGLPALEKIWGVPAQQIREKLQALGVKEKEKPPLRDYLHDGRFYISPRGDSVNISAKKQSPTRP